MISRLAIAAALLAAVPAAGAQERPVIQYPPTAAPTPTPTPGSCDLSTATYETLALNTITASGASNAEGAWVLLGTTTAEYDSFSLAAAVPTSGLRGLVDVYIGQGTTPLIDDWGFSGSGTHKLTFGINVPSGSAIYARMRSFSANNTSVGVSLVGRRRLANCPAGFSRAEALNPDLATSRMGLAETPTTNAWTEQVASTANAYGAILVNAGAGTTNPTTSQLITVQYGTGASGSEQLVAGNGFYQSTGANGPLGSGGYYFVGTIPAGTRLSARVNAPTADSAVRVQLMGFR